MNRKQIECIEWELENISRDMDRIDKRIDKREAEGDLEKARRAYHKLDELRSKVQGIETVLNVMGLRISWELTDKHEVPHIVKWEKY